jgi:hypothetical protein
LWPSVTTTLERSSQLIVFESLSSSPIFIRRAMETKTKTKIKERRDAKEGERTRQTQKAKTEVEQEKEKSLFN